MNEIKRIVITSDLLRPVWINGKAKNKETVRINKYYDFLSWQLGEALNVPIQKLSTENTKFNFFTFYELCGIKFKNISNWLEIYDTENISEDAVCYFEEWFENSFIVCHEMPPVFKKICNILGLFYIDIRVHPVRYLDDHMFGMATNHPEVFENLKYYLVDNTLFYLYANMFKTTADFYDLKLDTNSALIVGQTNVDAALYENGKVHTIFEYEDVIREMGKQYTTVYYKPHPFNKDLKEIYAFLKQFPFIKIINENIYYLLSDEKIKAVYAISSGVLTEAEYFGKKAYPLYKKYLNYTYDKGSTFDPDLYITVKDSFYNPLFWWNVLKGIVETKEDCCDIQLPIRPNRMRAALNDYWGNTPLDPEVITVQKESKSLLDTEYYEKKISSLQQQIANLNGLIFKMNNNPIYEKNLLKRAGKELLFSLSEKNIYINAYAVEKKLKAMASLYKDTFNKVSKVKCITYRPSAPRGGRGGGGAVLSAMNAIIGPKMEDFPVSYKYSEKDGVWHTLKNKYFNEWTYPNYINSKSNLIMLWAAIAFVIEETKMDKDTLYVCHEYSTAAGLALLHKKYILVIHTQGPRLEEKTNLGEAISSKEGEIICRFEKMAMENAVKVCFPSIGGKDYFFNSKYWTGDKSKISFGDTLYNTVYADVQEEIMSEIAEEKESCTFLSVGTITYAKGQDLVCQFLEKLLKNDTSQKYRWICVGRGPYQEKVTALALQLEKQHKHFEFIYREKCSFREVKYLQMISDYYVMLHRISIFDLATLEAMQNANGLILSKTGGNLEYNCEENVLYLENNNYDQLVEKVINTDKEEQKNLNQKCYNEYFSKIRFKERYCRQILNVIMELEVD